MLPAGLPGVKTGARLGELLALEWENIDFNGKKIHIVQTLAVLPGVVKTQRPKTKKAQRVIPLGTATYCPLHKKKRSGPLKIWGFSRLAIG
ncbi:tyrosine-type recombinase/integrase [Desulfofundulus thermobenzoicus]|uniref:Tyrosine-type recombinase/integrase n=1 Tax=Desulfofundulus thermobenzoicus TaxID=29376 RepID=A0A6N7IQX4_9FIRM|nr:tyrosine-type recombinase/integrase [Desulfofundulus thermobenzoicus]